MPLDRRAFLAAGTAGLAGAALTGLTANAEAAVHAKQPDQSPAGRSRASSRHRGPRHLTRLLADRRHEPATGERHPRVQGAPVQHPKVNASDVDIHYHLDGDRVGGHRGANFAGKPMWLIINLQMEGNVHVGRNRA